MLIIILVTDNEMPDEEFSRSLLNFIIHALRAHLTAFKIYTLYYGLYIVLWLLY